jgi:hypothetical protein
MCKRETKGIVVEYHQRCSGVTKYVLGFIGISSGEFI